MSGAGWTVLDRTLELCRAAWIPYIWDERYLNRWISCCPRCRSGTWDLTIVDHGRSVTVRCRGGCTESQIVQTLTECPELLAAHAGASSQRRRIRAASSRRYSPTPNGVGCLRSAAHTTYDPSAVMDEAEVFWTAGDQTTAGQPPEYSHLRERALGRGRRGQEVPIGEAHRPSADVAATALAQTLSRVRNGGEEEA